MNPAPQQEKALQDWLKGLSVSEIARLLIFMAALLFGWWKVDSLDRQVANIGSDARQSKEALIEIKVRLEERIRQTDSVMELLKDQGADREQRIRELEKRIYGR